MEPLWALVIWSVMNVEPLGMLFPSDADCQKAKAAIIAKHSESIVGVVSCVKLIPTPYPEIKS